MALGASKTLEYLNLDSQTAMNPTTNRTTILLLAKAVAMNKMKNGALEQLSL